MKKILKILVLLAAFGIMSFTLFGISKADIGKIAEQIDREQMKIESEMESCSVENVEITQENTPKYLSEGDSVAFYRKNGVLKKVSAYSASEDVQTEYTDYYIRNGEPFLIVLRIYSDGEEEGIRKVYFSSDGDIVRIVDDGEIDDSGEYFAKYAADWSMSFRSVMSLTE